MLHAFGPAASAAGADVAAMRDQAPDRLATLAPQAAGLFARWGELLPRH